MRLPGLHNVITGHRQYFTDSMAKLKKNVGLWGATSVGVANIIGAGIFVLSGVAAGLAGPAVILSFLVAGFVALLTALSAAELSSFIVETGASYAFTKRAFGRFWSFLVGWFKYFDYIVGAAAVSVGFAAYFTAMFGLTGQEALFLSAIGIPIVFTVLNLIGIRESAYATSVMVLIKVFVLVLVVMLGGLYLAGHFSISNYVPFFPMGLNGMLNGSAIIFFAFLGFNTVSMLSEETRDPKRTIPKALLLAFGISFALYVMIAFLEIGLLDWRALGASASPIADLAATITSNRAFFDLVSFSALIATGSVLLSSIIGGTRASFAMGRDNLIPGQFDYVSRRFGTPWVSVIVGGAIIVALAGIFFSDIDMIASIVNFGTLFTYLFVHLSVLRLRKAEAGTERLFRVPLFPLLPAAGAVSCVLMMYYLSDEAKIISTAWAIVGLAVYAAYGRRHKEEKPPAGNG
jgi:APA family basic amino acid/polyamine antiporter